MLDTTRSVETPEGVELQFRIAGPVVRALAWAIDMSIRGVIYFVAGIVFGLLREFGIGLFLLTVFLLEWFYPVLFEVYEYGATPGKRVMKIRVLQAVGTPVGWSSAMIRNLLRAVDILPLFYGFGLITMLFNKDFQRLGDLAADTVVVYQEKVALLPSQKGQSSADALTGILLPALTLVEQQAIVSFAERARTLSPQRVTELANLVIPLTGKENEAGTQQLYQIATHLMGNQVETTRL